MSPPPSLFGTNVDPSVSNLQLAHELARATCRGIVIGPVGHVVEEIARCSRDLGMDALIVSPIMADEAIQSRLFAEEVVPAVRAALADA